VQDALKALRDAINELESELGRFGGENWREVVPDVESAGSGARDGFDKVRQELGVQES
jgi:hypothetical protein